MRIGLLIYGDLDTVSGGFLYDRQLVAHLRNCGDEVVVMGLPWDNYGRCLWHNFSNHLIYQLQNTQLDLLLQDELIHPSLFFLNQRLRRQLTYPLISIIHHLRCSEARSAWQNNFYRIIERRYLNTVDGFICNSQTTWTAVRSLLTRQRPFTIATPGGDRLQIDLLNEDAIAARAYEPGPLRLLFVGNVIPRKGLHILLTALAQLPSDSWQLAVVGDTTVDPDYTYQLQQQSNAIDLVDNITWHGAVNDATLAAIMCRSQLLVMPSSYEGFGIAYLEGMGVGLPAIATSSGAAHELITDNENGFLIKETDTAVLVQHLHTLHKNRPQLAEMSLNAHRQYLQYPTWQASMTHIRNFLTTLL